MSSLETPVRANWHGNQQNGSYYSKMDLITAFVTYRYQLLKAYSTPDGFDELVRNFYSPSP